MVWGSAYLSVNHYNEIEVMMKLRGSRGAHCNKHQFRVFAVSI